MTIFDNTFLENLKNAIIKCNINKSLIAKLSGKNQNIEGTDIEQSNIATSLSEVVDTSSAEASKNVNCNLDINDINKDLDTIYNNNKDIEQFLFSIIPVIDKYIQFETNKNLQKATQSSEKVKISQITENKTDKDLNKNAHSQIENFIENTLIISETQGKVFLPYFITDLEEISKCNDNMPFDEIIEQKYTLPISNFKVLSISRFREAFKLARNKEKKSFKFAFDLGLEVLFDYNLHPAIIAACRTLDELDIYLDYLDSGETDKFECFNIKFEIPPVLIKK